MILCKTKKWITIHIYISFLSFISIVLLFLIIVTNFILLLDTQDGLILQGWSFILAHVEEIWPLSYFSPAFKISLVTLKQ